MDGHFRANIWRTRALIEGATFFQMVGRRQPNSEEDIGTFVCGYI